MEGFRGTESVLRNALVNANQPFKCKAARLLAAYAMIQSACAK